MTPLPSWLELTVLALAAYRLTRLAGWDDFPLAAGTRDFITGAHWEDAEPPPEGAGLTRLVPSETVYDRPMLAHFLSCPFCVGWWISLALYLCWLWLPTETLYAAVPFAISGVVGLVSKNWDG